MFRRAAQARGWDVKGWLKSNRKMRLMDEEGTRHWMTLAEYATRLRPVDWQEAVWPSQAGGQKVYVHSLRTHIRKLGPVLLLITCHAVNAPTQSIRYWGSTLLEADTQTVINTLSIRGSIGVFFEDAKDWLVSDHHQLMSAEAILRFWTLIACLACFLEDQRATYDHLATWGEARRVNQQEHQRNPPSWLETQFQAGFPHIRLAYNYPYPVVTNLETGITQ